MGWFFGCFGGRGKKDRKHRTPASSPLPKQQKPLYAAPVCVPAAVSSSIPIKTVPAQERQSHEDLFTVRQVSSSAPVQHMQGAFLQGVAAGSRTPERQQKPGPWYQLDDLEEELEDLRKQIDKESQDAKKIKEEVSFLKSCGTLVKTPSELKSPRKVDHQPSSVPEGGWRSWLAPSASPNTRTSPVNNLQFEGLKAALCEPTPTKECHSLLFGVPTPVSSTRVTHNNVQHHSMQAQLHKEQFNQFKKGDISDTDHTSHDGIKYKSPVDMKPSQMNLSMSSPGLHNERILNKGERFENTMDGLLQTPKGILKQGNRSLCSIESSPCKDDIENENNSTKKRRLAVNVLSVQSPRALKKPVENDVGNGQDYDALCQKRLKVVSPVEQSKMEINNSLSHVDPVPMHFFRCDSLSPIMESGTSIEECTSYDNKGVSQGLSHQLHSYNSNNSSSQTSTQSPSLRQSPGSQTKSVTFASTNDEDYTTDELSYNRGAVEKHSEGSYTNSTCFNDTNDEDEEDRLATASYSPSIDSEETLSDLSPEHCFSPTVSPSDAKSSTIYRSQDNSASTHEKRTAKRHTISSTQYSSVYGGKKKQHVSRYDSEEDDITEDDYDLYTDAMSHVSTECSEREQHRRWHGRTESMDSVSAHFAQLGRATDLNSIDTPPKLSVSMATPNVDISGRAGKHTSRLRSKPASSVLTPVENVSQWKQLKERDHKLDVIATAGSDESSKTNPSKHVQRAGDSRPNIWDENKNSAWTPSNKAEGKQLASHEVPISVNARLPHWGPTSDAEPVNVNASLSHWGIISKADSIRLDASLSQWGTTATTEMEPVRVDMSLSHWLKSSSKHYEAHKSLGTSSTTSSSGGGGVISPAPKLQTTDYVSPNSVTRTQKSQYVASERPILGALGGDCPSGNAKQRSPWDGKGTPNSTAKYMEDKRVKWHSTPFEQRLDKALDKQGILLQKKLFAATPAVL